MTRILLAIFFMSTLAGCDAVSDMKEMFKKQEIVQEAIKEKYGWESQVGFKMHNGVLTRVTLVLNADDVREEKVSRLDNIAREVIESSFKSEPQAIFIQIASVPRKKS